ncbi:MAG: DnaJ domain-containing protein [Halioglobus sp.]|nr:DnaJ domain-containing protein [Halioglobus sp.]
MKNRRNYYRILHVQPDAPQEVIRSSYRTIMHKMRVHPDLGGDAEAAALVNEAYSVLSDDKNRSDYDRLRASSGWTRAANDDFRQALALTPPAATPCLFCSTPAAPREHEAGLTAFCGHCDSPLAQVSTLDGEETDRRAIDRVPKKLHMMIWTSWPQLLPYTGSGDDISLTGMHFNATTYLAVEQVIKIDTPALKSVAEVVRCQPTASGWEAGVKFLSLCFARSRGSFVEVRA